MQDCSDCPRLVAHRNAVKARYPDYHCRPVEPWGSSRARLLVVGLAPGLHGANRTGRPFTGDSSGDFLFAALHRAGFATAPTAARARLRDVRITNAVRCLPPDNRPTTSELHNCSAYLARELADLWRPRVRRPRCVLALGRLAHSAVALAGGWTLPEFRHGQNVPLAPGLLLIDSYHPSRQNTNTGRLTADMLDAVLAQARRHLDGLRA
jgi:uracil-DNA glycosylase family 4